jgi:heme iron utilization protein
VDADLAPLRAVLESQDCAALATLHDGEPFVSMVPFAVQPDGAGFIIHVSTLATHTRDMLASPRVSLLVMDAPRPDVMAQARPRLTLQGTARQLLASSAERTDAKATYLARFPESEPLFGFTDFSLFVITPTSARWVGGFAQAKTISAARLAEILRRS